MVLAYRVFPKKPMELSMPITVPDRALPESLLQAEFTNGDIIEVPNMTVGQFRLLDRVACKPGSDVLWEGENEETHHKVQIMQNKATKFCK